MASLATGQSKYRLLWEAELADGNCPKANMELVNSASHSCRILIGQLKRKPSESCHKLRLLVVRFSLVKGGET